MPARPARLPRLPATFVLLVLAPLPVLSQVAPAPGGPPSLPGLIKSFQHGGTVWTVAFAPDGQTVASGGQDRAVQVWEVATGNKRARMKVAGVVCLAYAPDGKTLASAPGGGCVDYVVRLWDPATGRELRRCAGHTSTVDSVAFSPDGTRLVTGGVDQVRVWEAATGKEVAAPRGHTKSVLRVAFSPDNKTLASVGDDETVRLWDWPSGKERHALAGHAGQVTAVAFSPDGRLVASGGGDATTRLWDARTGEKMWEFSYPQGALVQGVAFTRDGRTAAVGTAQGVILLLEVATGRERGRLSGHSGNAYAVTAAPDGRTLASCGHDGSVRLWDLTAPRAAGVAPGATLSAARLESLWDDLAGADAVRAFRAVNTLAAAPEDALPFLRGRVKRPERPVPPDAVRLARLLAALDDDDYRGREEASAELGRLGALVEPALRRALADSPSFEVRRRARKLLDVLGPVSLSPDRLRHARVDEVLGRIGTPEALGLRETLP